MNKSFIDSKEVAAFCSVGDDVVVVVPVVAVVVVVVGRLETTVTMADVSPVFFFMITVGTIAPKIIAIIIITGMIATTAGKHESLNVVFRQYGCGNLSG